MELYQPESFSISRVLLIIEGRGETAEVSTPERGTQLIDQRRLNKMKNFCSSEFNLGYVCGQGS